MLLGQGFFSYEINTNGHGSLGLLWFDEYDGGGRGRGGPGGGGGGGRGPGGRGAGPTGTCTCASCGHQEPHRQGKPCNLQTCPKCGAAFLIEKKSKGEATIRCIAEGCDYNREAAPAEPTKAAD